MKLYLTGEIDVMSTKPDGFVTGNVGGQLVTLPESSVSELNHEAMLRNLLTIILNDSGSSERAIEIADGYAKIMRK